MIGGQQKNLHLSRDKPLPGERVPLGRGWGLLVSYITFSTAYPLQQRRRRFIVRVLWHEFAAEGFGEQGGGELFDLGAGSLIVLGEAADDLVLYRRIVINVALLQTQTLHEKSRHQIVGKSSSALG